jgi:ubiquinone/menaquinone biosynthesis C-methylase UbiE
VANDVLSFWNSRAGLGTWAGTNDIIAKQIEMKAIMSYVKDGMNILDIGCGNGITAIEIARKYHVTVLGMDYAHEMIANAKELAKGQDLMGSVKFEVGDVMALSNFAEPDFTHKYDIIYTERTIVNLPDWKAQKQAIIDIVGLLKEGGKFVMCENSQDGLDAINVLRLSVGLPSIIHPWHNRYLYDAEIKKIKEVQLLDINYYSSTYYFLSRVVNAWQSAQEGKEPEYEAPINKLALQLPAINKMGQGRIWVWTQK